MNNIEQFLKDFLGLWQTARVYELKHPRFLASLESTYTALLDVLRTQSELVIGVIGDELASGDDIFFDLSKKVVDSILYLKNLGIEKISFKSYITKDELTSFISLLISPNLTSPDNFSEHFSLLGINNILVGSILAPGQLKNKKVNLREQGLKDYRNCLVSLKDTFGSLIEEDTVDPQFLRLISTKIMDKLMQDYQAFSDLVQVKSHDVSTFMHLLNVSALSMYFSHMLGFSRQECMNIGVAGLFHDIGKLYIEQKILKKPGKLDCDEWNKIKSHTVYGSAILIRHQDSIGILPAIVALEHHRCFDSSGYPITLFKHNLHIGSLIVSICDVYDALSSRRSYKQDYPPEAIYGLMIKDKGKRFSSELLSIFFKVIGVWPKNSLVLLNDQSVAVVREINQKRLFSPIVEVMSKDSKEIIDLSKNRDIRIEHSLNPFTQGKEYITLI